MKAINLCLRNSIQRLGKLQNSVPGALPILQKAFSGTSNEGTDGSGSGIDDLRAAAKLATEESEKISFTDNFPVESPLLAKDASSNARILRNEYLKGILAKKKSIADRDQGRIDDAHDEFTRKEREMVDPDTGFAELGGFSAKEMTGMLNEQPIKLHPVRFFSPGQFYEPEELHPLGAASHDTKVRKRARGPVRVYPEEDLKTRLNFKNLLLMNNYLSDAGLILPRRTTRLSGKFQKKLVKSVKLAQALALLPILDRRPEFKRRSRRVIERSIFS